jgi:hypothetical protein
VSVFAVGINRRDVWPGDTLFSFPRRHHDFSNGAVQGQNAKRYENLESWRAVEEKELELGFRGQEDVNKSTGWHAKLSTEG